MKFLHTGDLHIGKTLCDFSLLEDQRHMLNSLAEIAKEENIDAILIAGDIYDRAIPSAEAVVILDGFLTGMVQAGIVVFMISGNHDSPERIGFASGLLEKSGVYMAGPVAEEGVRTVTLEDSFGKVNVTLLPFVKPSAALAKTSAEAVEKLLAAKRPDPAERNILMTHFFVTNNGAEPELSDAETTIHVGGLDNVEAELFKEYDYVALGHIHRAQKISDRPVFYAGAPLAYSFSEAGKIKSVMIVEIGNKNDISVKKRELTPLRKLRKLRGSLEDLLKPDVQAGEEAAETGARGDYLQITLTDEEELIDPIGTLRTVYPNVMQLLLAKNERKEGGEPISRLREKNKRIPELFADFYEMVRGEEPDEERRKVIEQTARLAADENI